MEFPMFLALLRRRVGFLLLTVVLGALLAFLLLPATDGAQRAEATVSVAFSELAPQDATGVVQYDGYYLIEAQRRFGDIIGQALTGPSVQQRFAASAGSAISRTSRISPLDFRVVMTGVEQEISPEMLATALQEAVAPTLAAAVERSGEPLSVHVTVADAVLLETPWTPIRSLLAGGLLGVLFGIFFLLLRHAAAHSETVVEEVVEVSLTS